jgi:hypothetical protein
MVMRWKQLDAAGILNLLALVLNAQRWTQFGKNKSLWYSSFFSCLN